MTEAGLGPTVPTSSNAGRGPIANSVSGSFVPFSRRRLLGAGVAVGTAAAVEALVPPSADAAARRQTRAREVAAHPHEAPISSLIARDEVLHLGRRATYGLTPDLRREILRKGTAAWLEEQLRPASIDDSICDRYLARFPMIGLSPAQYAARVPFGSFEQMNEMASAYFVRSVWSERQLYEMVVEFWWNHFNIGLPDSDVWNLCGALDTVLREGALGRFDDLLVSVARSPAMLVRLNQNLSVGENPNENYAREMLELHTVGAAAGYSQQDVHHAALLLTGWGVGRGGTSFAFTPAHHYVGPVSVMGFSSSNASAAGGEGEVERYLRYLAHHPATARHLASKLCLRFVSDDPPPSLVARLAALYLDSGTEIVPVLRALLSSPEFFDSVGEKVRRPVESVAASLRILGYVLKNGGTADIADVVFALEIMGQLPLGWPQPNGYPDTATAWMSASAVQAEWALHTRLAGGWWTETLVFPGVESLVTGLGDATKAGAYLDAVCERLLFQKMNSDHRQVLLSYIGRKEDEPVGSAGEAGVLQMIVKLVLDSPYFAVR